MTTDLQDRPAPEPPTEPPVEAAPTGPGGRAAVEPLTAEGLRQRIDLAVGEAFTLFTEEQQRARHTVYGLSMSGLGGCRRKGAYQLAEVEPSDPELAMSGEKRAANLGTMIHTGLLPALATVLGGREEISVQLVVTVDEYEVRVPGRSDLYWPDARCLLDLKTVGEHRLGERAAHGVADDHKIQVAGYALGAERNGHPVDWIGWIYLDRASGGTFVIVEAFTDAHRALVTERCRELLNYAASPNDAPRDGAGPGDRAANAICNGCAWLKACWGPTAQPGVAGAQATRVEDFGGMQQVLVGYLNAREVEGDARDRKDFYRELIVGNPQGVYGTTRWSMSKPSRTVDKTACVQIIEDSGQPLPMKDTEPRLVVAWVVPDQAAAHTTQGGEKA